MVCFASLGPSDVYIAILFGATLMKLRQACKTGWCSGNEGMTFLLLFFICLSFEVATSNVRRRQQMSSAQPGSYLKNMQSWPATPSPR